MEYCEPTVENVAEAYAIAKQIEVEFALLLNIQNAFRIALDWKTERNANSRKLSTLRFVAASFERHLTRLRALSEHGGYMQPGYRHETAVRQDGAKAQGNTRRSAGAFGTADAANGAYLSR